MLLPPFFFPECLGTCRSSVLLNEMTQKFKLQDIHYYKQQLYILDACSLKRSSIVLFFSKILVIIVPRLLLSHNILVCIGRSLPTISFMKFSFIMRFCAKIRHLAMLQKPQYATHIEQCDCKK